MMSLILNNWAMFLGRLPKFSTYSLSLTAFLESDSRRGRMAVDLFYDQCFTEKIWWRGGGGSKTYQLLNSLVEGENSMNLILIKYEFDLE